MRFLLSIPRVVCALLAPFVYPPVGCSSPPPSIDGGPQPCATAADCRNGQACQAASHPGFCGDCVQGANFAVRVGHYCLETGWGSDLGDGGLQGDNCPIGSAGCVVGEACTQLLRCDVGDTAGLYECPPDYVCNFEQCVPSSNADSLPCPPGSSYFPTSSTCGALLYLEKGQVGTCVLYAPPCGEDAGDQSCPAVLGVSQPADGYVSGPVQQMCLPDVLNGNGNVCTPLRTCNNSSNCTDGLFSTCYYVNPQTAAPTGTCVDATGPAAGSDATPTEGG